MITEDYVSFEIAKLLKEKGFDEECISVYHDEELQLVSSLGIFCGDGVHGEQILTYSNWSSMLISAPTIQMAMKWLREVHNLFVEIQYATSLLSQPHTTIYFQIYYMSLDYTTSGKNMLPDDYIREYYTSYEEACEAAIKYCLENLI